MLTLLETYISYELVYLIFFSLYLSAAAAALFSNIFGFYLKSYDNLIFSMVNTLMVQVTGFPIYDNYYLTVL